MATDMKPKKKASKRQSKEPLTPEARYLKIQAEAYYLAEKDGFQKDAVEYWLAAEAAVGE